MIVIINETNLSDKAQGQNDQFEYARVLQVLLILTNYKTQHLLNVYSLH